MKLPWTILFIVSQGSQIFLPAMARNTITSPSVKAQMAVISTSSVDVSSSSTAPLTPTQSPQLSTPNESKSNNPITQLFGYVRDSCVRLKDGTCQLYTDHKKCNVIRSKQRAHIKIQMSSMTEEQRKKTKKYYPTAGGISYEEFVFLQNGREDRSKLANIAFMMAFAPNFVPYAFMFFPEMLPSPFTNMSNSSQQNGISAKLDLLSRERCHAVISSLIDLEREARIAPALSNVNPFGKGKIRKNMERADSIGAIGAALLSAPSNSLGTSDSAIITSPSNEILNRSKQEASMVFDVLKDKLYTKQATEKNEQSLAFIPKSIMRGVGKAIDAPSFNNFLPTFLVRGRVLNHIKKISDADQFIIEQGIDTTTISDQLLADACENRLIGGLRRTNEELREGLDCWLDMVVKKPEKIARDKGMHFNANLARFALLGYHAVDAARDSRASSYLPRILFQGKQ